MTAARSPDSRSIPLLCLADTASGWWLGRQYRLFTPDNLPDTLPFSGPLRPPRVETAGRAGLFFLLDLRFYFAKLKPACQLSV